MFNAQTPAAVSSGTNYGVQFGSYVYNYVNSGSAVFFQSFSGTGGPVTYHIVGGVVIMWPTNLCTFNTAGLTLVGTNWQFTSTNNFIVSFLSLTNNPPLSKIDAAWNAN